MSKYRITIEGETYEVEVEKMDDKTSSSDAVKENPVISPKNPSEKTASSATAETKTYVKSPMPGTIIAIKAAVGDKVHKGQAVVVLEAMKMNNEIASPREGTITAIHISKGAAVQGGDVLFEIE